MTTTRNVADELVELAVDLTTAARQKAGLPPIDEKGVLGAAYVFLRQAAEKAAKRAGMVPRVEAEGGEQRKSEG